MGDASNKPGPIEVDAGVSSHIGLVRKRNEDTVWHSSQEDHRNSGFQIWAVADGMGGHRGGAEASRRACMALSEFYRRIGHCYHAMSRPELQRRLAETIFNADRYVRRLALGDPALAHMGTTLSCLGLTDDWGIIGHVGDSRIYRWRLDHLSCLTTDHTFVEEMIFEGELDPADAASHPLRHMLTHALGGGEPLAYVQTRTDRVKPGDRFLLSTDGLHNALARERIAQILSRPEPAAAISAALIADALERGASDNITAVVLKIVGAKPGRGESKVMHITGRAK